MYGHALGMYTDICMGMHIGMRKDMCTDMCAHIPIDIPVDPNSIHPHLDMHMGHEYRHALWA